MTRTFPSTEIIMSERRHAAQEAMSRALDFRPEEIRTPEPPDSTLVAQGCGPGMHRGPMGRCRSGGVVVAPRPPVVIAPRAAVVDGLVLGDPIAVRVGRADQIDL